MLGRAHARHCHPAGRPPASASAPALRRLEYFIHCDEQSRSVTMSQQVALLTLAPPTPPPVHCIGTIGLVSQAPRWRTGHRRGQGWRCVFLHFNFIFWSYLVFFLPSAAAGGWAAWQTGHLGRVLAAVRGARVGWDWVQSAAVGPRVGVESESQSCSRIPPPLPCPPFPRG